MELITNRDDDNEEEKEGKVEMAFQYSPFGMIQDISLLFIQVAHGVFCYLPCFPPHLPF